MTNKPPDLLDRVWDDIPVRPLPADLVTSGHAVRRRKHRMAFLAATAATVVAAGGTAALIQGLPSQDNPEAAPADRNTSALLVEVQDGTSPSTTVDYQATGGPVAFWEPVTREVTYVSGNEFSSTCTPTADATLTGTGDVALQVDSPDDRNCDSNESDAVRVAFSISGLTTRPDILNVINEDGTTTTVTVAVPTPPG